MASTKVSNSLISFLTSSSNSLTSLSTIGSLGVSSTKLTDPISIYKATSKVILSKLVFRLLLYLVAY